MVELYGGTNGMEDSLLAALRGGTAIKFTDGRLERWSMVTTVQSNPPSPVRCVVINGRPKFSGTHLGPVLTITTDGGIYLGSRVEKPALVGHHNLPCDLISGGDHLLSDDGDFSIAGHFTPTAAPSAAA